MPIILAMFNLKTMPKESSNTPMLSSNGSVKPKVCPYPNQLKNETSFVNSPIKPPNIIPENSKIQNNHVFPLCIVIPFSFVILPTLYRFCPINSSLFSVIFAGFSWLLEPSLDQQKKDSNDVVVILFILSYSLYN